MRRTGKLNFEADFSNGGNFQSKEQSSSGEVEYIFHLLYICKSMYSIFRITTFNMQIYPKSVTFQSCNQLFFFACFNHPFNVCEGFKVRGLANSLSASTADLREKESCEQLGKNELKAE